MSEARLEDSGNERSAVDRVSASAIARALSAPAQFALLALVAALSFPSAVATMVGQWTTSSTYHHGFVVFPLALWMIWRERGALGPATPSLTGAAAVAVFSAAWLAGRAVGADLVEHVAFVSVLIAAFAAVFGLANARRAGFGLVFMYFAAPFGQSLTPLLQAATVHAVTPLLALSGVALEQNGAVISTSAGRFEIADACAGLNFLLAALLVAAVFAGAAFRPWRKRLAFMALAAATALLANVLRAYLVILLATKTPLGMAFARDHAGFGWALYAAFLIALIAFGRRLQDEADLAAPSASGAFFAPGRIGAPAVAAACAMAGAGAIAALFFVGGR